MDFQTPKEMARGGRNMKLLKMVDGNLSGRDVDVIKSSRAKGTRLRVWKTETKCD